MKIKRFIIGFLGLACLVAVSLSVRAHAQSQPQPYAADNMLQLGTIVQISADDSRKVEPATQDNLNQMFGVVMSPDSLPITIVDENLKNQVFVATDGQYNVLVTDQNGPIKQGDNVTVSALKGTGMKASPEQEIILGKALNNFDGQENAIGSASLKDTNGNVIKNVNIGLLPVAIDIRDNPEVISTKTKLPPELERIGLQIAEKELSPFRIYLSIAIAMISVIVALVVIYAGVRNSIVSIGRNPLSRKSIFRALFQVILTGFIILIIGLFAVYLLLKL